MLFQLMITFYGQLLAKRPLAPPGPYTGLHRVYLVTVCKQGVTAVCILMFFNNNRTKGTLVHERERLTLLMVCFE